MIKQSLRKTIYNEYNCIKYFYPFIFKIGVFIKDFTFLMQTRAYLKSHFRSKDRFKIFVIMLQVNHLTVEIRLNCVCVLIRTKLIAV